MMKMNQLVLMVGPLIYSLFFAVLFLQSGLDKCFDFKGNLAWLEPHFSKTFFARFVRQLLILLTCFELASGLSFLLAVPAILMGSFNFFFIARALAGITLLFLFTGQRLAKDYAGASTIAIYFGVWFLAFFGFF
jgi:uncharacterized membrane protein YphA (DoxX/SURF4 family)